MAKIGRKAQERASTQRSRNVGVIALAIAGGLLVAGLVYAISQDLFAGLGTRGDITGAPCYGRGATGSTHEHVSFGVILSGQPVNFIPPDDPGRYQLKERYAHLEDNDGATIHVHATGLKLECFFDTLGWAVDGDALVTDFGEEYHTNDTHEVTFRGTDKDGDAIEKDDWWTLILGDGLSVTIEYRERPGATDPGA